MAGKLFQSELPNYSDNNLVLMLKRISDELYGRKFHTGFPRYEVIQKCFNFKKGTTLEYNKIYKRYGGNWARKDGQKMYQLVDKNTVENSPLFFEKINKEKYY